MLPPSPGRPSAASVAKARFGGATTVKPSDVTVGTTVTPLCQNNPKRIQLSLTNWGQGLVSFGTNPSLTANTGSPLQPNGGNAIIIVTEDGEPTAWAWYAISPTANNPIHVEETEIV